MTWREPPSQLPTDHEEPVPAGYVEGEPSTKDDEFARDDAPEQPYEDD